MMRLALDEAQKALFITSPNPRVGCVITRPSGEIIGVGHTQVAGQAHAEVMALRDAQSRGHSTQGATAYVTLEPCSHHGRTPPCTQALSQAGIARVFLSLTDPNPRVNGLGVAQLKSHGIEVHIGLMESEALELNKGFFKRMRLGSPWMRSKIAASLDGQTALLNGQSQWITGDAARADGHLWRARACAILTGVGTLLSDNPRLDVRGVDSPRAPALVVVDSLLSTPIEAHALQFKRSMYLYCALPLNEDSSDVLLEMDEQRRRQYQERLRALKDKGVEVIGIPFAKKNDSKPQVDLTAMVLDLGQKGMNEVHIEAGATLNGALIQSGLIDEFLLYMAPKWIGPAKPMSTLPPLEQLANALALDFQSLSLVGEDLRILAEKKGAKSALRAH
jgi:diaminohydroxyphosphoribosylaminopyrimidine deaminase/5-amino-6-(5-phosphoribosylamino)uracil reductase